MCVIKKNGLCYTLIIIKKTQHPVSWQVSADGARMIGHMILRKSLDGEDILGLKISGGELFPNGARGAIVEKVKRGSIADQEGHIKPGNKKNSVAFL